MDKLTHRRGFSIIEILIAMAIMIIVVSGVVGSSGGFGVALRGHQGAVLGAQTNAEAVTLAQKILEQAQALGRQDFGLVTNTATTSIDGFYYKSVDITQPDPQTDLVTVTISWRENNATSTVRVSTIVTNLENVNSPNTCSSFLTGNWYDPQIAGPFDVVNGQNNKSGNPVTDIDILHSKLYIVTDNIHGDNMDFYIYETTPSVANPTASPTNPMLVLGSPLQVDPGSQGLNAIAVASTSSDIHAFVANARSADFNKCKPSTGANCSQLEIFKVTNPTSPGPVISFLLSTSTAPYVTGSAGGAVGKSIFYKDGYIYLGLTTTSNGPAFHIIDVHNPSSPFWVGSWPSPSPTFGPSGAPINGIYVKGKYAYLSHPKDLIGPSGSPMQEQITVLDISNPTNPQKVSYFYDNGGIGGNGRSVYPAGDKLYFARTWTSNSHHEFEILDNSDPERLFENNPNPPEPFGKTIGESLTGVVVRSNLAFLVSSTTIQILDVSIPQTISPPVKSWSLPSLIGSGSVGTASDCEGNAVYFGSYRSNNQKGVILVVYPSP